MGTGHAAKVPGRAWVVTGAGVAVNLCLGILYAWSVWKANVLASADHPAGSAMTGQNEGWVYLADDQATLAYAVCGFTFALFMVPGGRLQDRYGPRAGATLGGLFLGAGCVVAGLMRSSLGLVLGFGVLGGVGMGLGYAATTPAAVRWFGPHRRGLVVGLVVAGYGAAAVYISPLAEYLIGAYGLSGSFIALGGLFAVVVIAAGQLLRMPPAGYVPPAAASVNGVPPVSVARVDWTPGAMLGTWQFFALFFLMFASAQSGLLVIANAKPLLKETARGVIEFPWLLVSFGGVVNALGRVGTGLCSDRVGRTNAYTLNAVLAAACLVALPAVVASGIVPLLYLVLGVIFWQYGGTLSLLPAWTADFFGSKSLGLNYGLVFLGWGAAFAIPLVGGAVRVRTGNLDAAFYGSAALLGVAIVVSRFVSRPEASAVRH